jgi:hypothetical protein
MRDAAKRKKGKKKEFGEAMNPAVCKMVIMETTHTGRRKHPFFFCTVCVYTAENEPHKEAPSRVVNYYKRKQGTPLFVFLL